ncbi:MAG TPA: inositol monophosphatase family protein [Candidatus Nanoarchaeia archaeon]|nr:inositol monophosphatase family protein [Candidatus Nanoarchaeia archaeon]
MSPSKSPIVSNELLTLISLAKNAGEAILGYHGNCKSTVKSDGTPSTIADETAGRIISAGLRERRYLVVNEEEAECVSTQIPEAGIAWVDPIDGTEEFVKGTEKFWMLIGIARQNIPVLGVAYNPVTKEVFFAENNGCYQEKKTASVQSIYLPNLGSIE